MDQIAQYLLTVTSAGIVCSFVRSMAGKSKVHGKLINVVTGVFLSITLFSPIFQFQFRQFTDYLTDFSQQGQEAAQAGTQMAANAIADIIKEQTQAYILDEALRLGLDLTVEVKLSSSDPPTPVMVILSGKASPYNKACLCQFITEKVGISQENQQWN